MCGIAGIHGGDPKTRAAKLEAMLKAIAYRGPDSSGTYANDEMAMGMNRLAIVDIEGGGQPIYNEDRTVAVTFNGEIYNHVELRAELEAAGHTFRTRCDTEVIVHAYEDDHDGFLDRLRGDFAIALWDDTTRQLLLARDGMGVKPLYWTAAGPDCVMWASELKALLAAGVPRDIEAGALADFVRYGFTPYPRTLIYGVFKLQPGTALSIDDNGVAARRWWDIPLAPREPSEVSIDAAADELEAHLQHAVDIRLRADVPVGVMLSGGIDSAVVAAMAAKRGRLHAFTAACDLCGAADAPYARQAANLHGIALHEVTFDAADVAAVLGEVGYILDEPLGDTAAVSALMVARAAKEHVGAVLSGIGADELYCGLGRNLRGMHALPTAYGRTFEVFNVDQVKRLTGQDAPPSVARRRLHAADNPADGDPCAIIQYLSCKTYLVDQWNHVTDRMTMGVPIEGRAPYLDRDVVEHAFTLPGTCKSPDHGKAVLKRLADRYYPDGFVRRQKVGFGVARERLLDHPATRRAIFDMVAGERSKARCWLHHGAVQGVSAQAVASKDPMAQQRLWVLFALELWARIYIDGDDPSAVVEGD